MSLRRGYGSVSVRASSRFRVKAWGWRGGGPWASGVWKSYLEFPFSDATSYDCHANSIRFHRGVNNNHIRICDNHTDIRHSEALKSWSLKA